MQSAKKGTLITTLDMASQLKFFMFSACVLVLFVMVAAQYGDGGSNGSNMPNDMPGMNMGPAPQSSAPPRSLTYPAIIAILLPMFTFLVAKEKI